jgi:hypothetical protein
MRKIHKKLVMAVAAATFATLGLAGAAGAATSDPTTARVPALNLSAAQRQESQAQVDEALTDSSLAAAKCPRLFVCIWTDTNFRGVPQRKKLPCGKLLRLKKPFTENLASIQNNQTPGRQTVIYNDRKEILNANIAPSKINDTGVLNRSKARFWKVC